MVVNAKTSVNAVNINDDTETVKALIAGKADVNVKSPNGLTAMQITFEQENDEMIDVLKKTRKKK